MKAIHKRLLLNIKNLQIYFITVKKPVLHSHCAGQDYFFITATLKILLYIISKFSLLPYCFQFKMLGVLKKSFRILSCTVFLDSLRSSGSSPAFKKFFVYKVFV